MRSSPLLTAESLGITACQKIDVFFATMNVPSQDLVEISCGWIEGKIKSPVLRTAVFRR